MRRRSNKEVVAVAVRGCDGLPANPVAESDLLGAQNKFPRGNEHHTSPRVRTIDIYRDWIIRHLEESVQYGKERSVWDSVLPRYSWRF